MTGLHLVGLGLAGLVAVGAMVMALISAFHGDKETAKEILVMGGGFSTMLASNLLAHAQGRREGMRRGNDDHAPPHPASTPPKPTVVVVTPAAAPVAADDPTPNPPREVPVDPSP